MYRKKFIGWSVSLPAWRPTRLFACRLVSLIACFLFALCSLPSAAYAADKLVVKDSQGNTKFLVTDTGQVIMNGGVINPTRDNASTIFLGINTENSGPTHGAGVYLRSNDGAANAEGDRLGLFAFDGMGDATTGVSAAAVTAYADGDFSTTSSPGRLSFLTAPSGSTAPIQRLTINNAGNVGIGITNPNYPLAMASGAYVTTGGVWTNASSREYKKNIKDLTTEEAMLAFNKLNPVTFNYKVDNTEKHTGFIAEDVPELIASKDRKGLSPMDVVAVLTKVIQEQSKVITELSDKVRRLEQLIK